MHSGKRDWLFLLFWPIIASILSLLLHANFIVTTLVFMGVPAVYLSFRCRERIAKTALFSLVFSVPLVFVFEYIFEVTSYHIPSALPFLLFGVIPLEVFVWCFLFFYFVVLYYEHFLEPHTRERFATPYLRYAVAGLLVFLAAFFAVLVARPDWLRIPYAYLVSGLVLAVLPVVSVLLRFPNLFTKFFKAAAYFFYFAFVYEIVALKLGNWEFWGKHFIGWISILGVKFPFEEFFFWIMLSSLWVLSLYEYFDDDRK